MTTYYSLPFEVVVLISQVAPAAWYNLVQADSRLGRYSLVREILEDAQDRFTCKTVTKKKTTYYLPNGVINRNGDQPAIIYNNGTKHWIKNGKSHREGDLPAFIEFRSNPVIVRNVWYQNDKIHRDGDLPAIIEYTKRGNIGCNYWYQYDKKHRDGDLPAIIEYNKHGNIRCNYWYQYDKKHRDGDKPAAVEYSRSGKILNSFWCKNGKRHRSGIKSAVVICSNPNIISIHHYGTICNEILNKPSSNISYSTLPLYIILRVAQYSPVIWWGLICADPRISRNYGFLTSFKMREHFTNCTIEIVDQPLGLGRGKRKVYRLPNGIIHRDNNKPAVIYECGLKKWYYNGKLHRKHGLPAVRHIGYIEKWYANGNLDCEHDEPSVKIYKLSADSYDNEYYN
jgi:hypothetical protein